MKALMLATACIRRDDRGPVLEVQLQPRTDAERVLAEKLSPILPLHFRLPITSVSGLAKDGTAILDDLMLAQWGARVP